MKLQHLPLIVGLSLFGCMASQPTIGGDMQQVSSMPAWMLQLPQSGPYLYGVADEEVYGGQFADALQRAKQKAIVAMFSELRSTISAETSSMIREDSFNGVSAVTRSAMQQVTARVEDVSTEGVETELQAHNPDAAKVYVRVRLQRTAMQQQLMGQMQHLDQTLLTGLQQAPSQPLKKLRAISMLLPDVAKQQAVIERYLLLGAGTGAAQVRPYSAGKQVVTALDQLLATIPIYVDATASDSQFQSLMQQSLTTTGYKVTPSRQQAELLINLATKFDSTEKKGRYYSFATAKVQLVNREGEIIAEINEKSKGVSQLANQAQDKAIAAITSQITGKLADSLFVK